MLFWEKVREAGILRVAEAVSLTVIIVYFGPLNTLWSLIKALFMMYKSASYAGDGLPLFSSLLVRILAAVAVGM
jgi:hypothetical protein